MKSERMAEIGLELLQAAVLECLRDAKGESLTPAQISKRLGIPPAPPIHSGSGYYHAVHDAVRKLEAQGCIQRDPEHTHRWQLTVPSKNLRSNSNL